MAGWPLLADVKTYLGHPASSYDDDRLQRQLDAAVEAMAEDTGVPLGSDDVKPYLIEAVLLLVSRLHARRDTPLGVQGFSTDFAARIMRTDPDIQAMMQRAFTNWPIG